MVFELYCTAELIFCVFFLCSVLFFFNHCIFVFVLLCFCFILCFIGNIVTVISYHGRPARWIIPFWQPAYSLHLYTHVYFSHGK